MTALIGPAVARGRRRQGRPARGAPPGAPVPAAARDAWAALDAALTVHPVVPCRTGDPDAWWCEDRAEQATRVAELCRPCPVRPECLAFAVAARERHGIWGGTTPRDRGHRRPPTTSGGRPAAEHHHTEEQP